MTIHTKASVPRIIIADDHDMVRRGLCLLLEEAGAARIVGEARAADAMISLLERIDADLLVTDFSMPSPVENDGAGMLELVARRWPTLPVVVLTMATSVHIIRTILQTGAKAVVGKADGVAELIRALEAARQDRIYLGNTVQAILRGAEGDTLGGKCVPTLTIRESEVLRMYASGLAVGAIATKLNKSRKTISRQKMSAMDKLSLRSDLEIYEYARRQGLRTR